MPSVRQITKKTRREQKRNIFVATEKKIRTLFKNKVLSKSIYISIYISSSTTTHSESIFVFTNLYQLYNTHTYKYIKEPNEAMYLLLVEVSFN